MADEKSGTYALDHVEDSSQFPNHKPNHIAIQTDTYAIDEDALGTNLPERYYWSPGFVGTVIVSFLLLEHCCPLWTVLHELADT